MSRSRHNSVLKRSSFASTACWLPISGAALAACLLSCRSSTPSSDANSNWLAVCVGHADCNDGRACICGLCTRTCDSDAECAVGETESACVAPGEAAADLVCNAVLRGSDQLICLATCHEDAGCPDGQECRAGACWRVAAPTFEPQDASQEMPADADARAPEPIAGTAPAKARGIDAGLDVWTIDAGIDFDQPVRVPAPTSVIQTTPDTPSLAGTWRDQTGHWRALRLDMVQDGSGLSGTVMMECHSCQPKGPVAPATDPDEGYPVELSVTDQNLLRVNLLGHHPYRVYEGRADASGLSFWFSAQDLWSTWCALQTPYPVEIAGRSQYTCVDDLVPFDLGPMPGVDAKHLLCTSDNPVCTCDAEHCRARLEQTVHMVRLRFEGEALVGTWSASSLAVSDTYLLHLERDEESP